MKTLIKTLEFENGSFFAVKDGRRTNISDCPFIVEIYEIKKNIQVLGIVGYEMKIIHNAEINCETTQTSRDITEEYIESISRYEFVGDVQREDGIFERFLFDRIKLTHFDLFKKIWKFDIEDSGSINRLIKI